MQHAEVERHATTMTGSMSGWAHGVEDARQDHGAAVRGLVLARFLNLASNRIDPPPELGFVWPYEVGLGGLDGPRPRVAFSEGVAHGAAGGQFGIRDALGPHWRKHIGAAGGDWLMPYLRRIATGGKVSEEELAGDFERRHGHPPRSYDWDVADVPARFLRLATGDGREVDVSVDELPPLIVFSAGSGPMTSGGVFGLTSALEPEWAEHIERAGGGWLLPLLQQLADGDDLGEIDLEHAYFDLHGHPPDSYALTTMNWRG